MCPAAVGKSPMPCRGLPLLGGAMLSDDYDDMDGEDDWTGAGGGAVAPSAPSHPLVLDNSDDSDDGRVLEGDEGRWAE